MDSPSGKDPQSGKLVIKVTKPNSFASSGGNDSLKGKPSQEKRDSEDEVNRGKKRIKKSHPYF
ncbi:hypothetical protein C5167_007658 [Papaver somniferum]|nr:hypothetical protein C5167_007658 [Papaver somniferum]